MTTRTPETPVCRATPLEAREAKTGKIQKITQIQCASAVALQIHDDKNPTLFVIGREQDKGFKLLALTNPAQGRMLESYRILPEVAADSSLKDLPVGEMIARITHSQSPNVRIKFDKNFISEEYAKGECKVSPSKTVSVKDTRSKGVEAMADAIQQIASTHPDLFAALRANNPVVFVDTQTTLNDMLGTTSQIRGCPEGITSKSQIFSRKQ